MAAQICGSAAGTAGWPAELHSSSIQSSSRLCNLHPAAAAAAAGGGPPRLGRVEGALKGASPSLPLLVRPFSLLDESFVIQLVIQIDEDYLKTHAKEKQRKIRQWPKYMVGHFSGCQIGYCSLVAAELFSSSSSGDVLCVC